MVPPFIVVFFCSSIMQMTGCVVSGSFSVDEASAYPSTFLANSTTHICIPRQMPRKGIPFSRAYLMAWTLPSRPLSPNPGATRMPSAPFSSSSTFSGVTLSLWRVLTCTLQSFAAPAWTKASWMDLYASCSSTYLPTRTTSTSYLGFLILSRKVFHLLSSGVAKLSIWSLRTASSSRCSSCMLRGT